MPIARLIYISECCFDSARGTAVSQLSAIMSASQRNNSACGVTGALIFDDRWFVQALEGDKRAIWTTFKRISEDDRHSDTLLVDMRDVETRLFGSWWMALATRNAATEPAFAPFCSAGLFNPTNMSGEQILDLMAAVAALSAARSMVDRAA